MMMRKYSSRFATFLFIYKYPLIDSFTDSLEFGTVKLLRFSCFAAFIASGEFSLFLLRGSKGSLQANLNPKLSATGWMLNNNSP
jgi:hypothetical protein